MWEFIVKNWGPLYALASLVGLIVIILLSKTYAKREDVTGLAATSLQLEDTAESQTTDTTKAVNTNLNCHVILPLG